MNQDFMKEKPVFPLLLSMGVPMILSMILGALYNIVDSIFVSKISEDAMTALSLVYPIQNLIHAAGVGFGIGMNAAIARILGEGKSREANMAASQGMLLSLIHGLVLTVLGIAAMPWFLRMFTDDETTIAYGLSYANIVLLFSAVDALGMAYEKIYQAVGKMVLAMMSVLVGCLTNIVLDPLLIFGLGPFPEMGIEGAAWATGIGQTAALVFYVVVNGLRPLNVKISVRQMLPREGIWKSMYSVGIAAALNIALASFLLSALNWILAPFSQVYILVLGVYYKLQALLYQAACGLVQGMRPLVGYNYGAGEYGRVKSIFRAAVIVIVGIMAAGTILCQAAPDWLMGLFTENAGTIEKGRAALRIISLGFIFSAVSVAASGALEGMGQGLASLKISLMRYVIVIIPAAFFLSRVLGLGPAGVWHSFWIAETVTAAMSWLIYRRYLASLHIS